ncbi:hypothetical protein BCO_0900088 (plasmid) [Borrelia coriaceae ATCC 43381]|uniref:Uncharacterized protein n=1 Tax=Borrelia coriaceae ATCC 43381 TaxID=1408429 RepID=W5T2B8_9SPIR|nr:hypothetical protein BCO_0900088 [Borrelia coriaceae ATCC 43381]
MILYNSLESNFYLAKVKDAMKINGNVAPLTDESKNQ